MFADTALLILRLTVGLIFVGHGSQKLFGWFGGSGMAGHTAMTEKQGLRPAPLWALTSALAEFGGGLLMTLGLFTPIAAALFISVMVMAIAKVHAPKGFWNTQGGYEYNLTLIAVAVALGLAGPGAPALDNWFALPVPQWLLFAASLIVVLIGDGIGLAISATHSPQLQQRHRPR